MHRVGEVEVDIDDAVVEMEKEDEVVEEDVEEKGQRIEVAHTAEGTTIPPKTAGSVKRSKTSNISNHVSMLEMLTMTMK
jgi:hypothetical protein